MTVLVNYTRASPKQAFPFCIVTAFMWHDFCCCKEMDIIYLQGESPGKLFPSPPKSAFVYWGVTATKKRRNAYY